MSDLLIRLMDAIRIHRSNRQLSRAQLDELMILIESIEDELPTRFINISKAFDQKYSRGNSEQTEFLERLVTIYETQQSVPNRPNTDLITNDELTPTFELNKKEADQVLKLCAKMRKIVLATTSFDEAHKIRLLNRITAIEKEIHKPRGRFDVVLAGVSDIGETLGKFGLDIKPLTDRITEVAQITRGKTKAYDQIPAPEEILKIEDKTDEGDDD